MKKYFFSFIIFFLLFTCGPNQIVVQDINLAINDTIPISYSIRNSIGFIASSGIASVNFSIENPAIASVNGIGTLTGISEGDTKVVVTLGNIKGSGIIKVISLEPVATLDLVGFSEIETPLYQRPSTNSSFIDDFPSNKVFIINRPLIISSGNIEITNIEITNFNNVITNVITNVIFNFSIELDASRSTSIGFPINDVDIDTTSSSDSTTGLDEDTSPSLEYRFKFILNEVTTIGTPIFYDFTLTIRNTQGDTSTDKIRVILDPSVL